MAVRPAVVPYLSYRDAAAALDFLQEAFGAIVTMRFDDLDGVVQHAEVKVSGGVVMVGTAGHPQLPLRGTSVGYGTYVVVDDVDSCFARARDAGARVVLPPEETDWGGHRCRVLDLEGYEWTFGTYRPSIP